MNKYELTDAVLSHSTRSEVATPPTSVPSAQYPLERLPELRTEYRVNNRIQGGVEITQPKEKVHRGRCDVTGISAERHHKRHDKKRQPTDDESPRDDRQGLSGFPLSFRLETLLLVLPERYELIDRGGTNGDLFREYFHPADIAHVALMTCGTVIRCRCRRLFRRHVVGNSRVVLRRLRLRYCKGRRLLLLPHTLLLRLFLDHVHRRSRLAFHHYQRRD